MPLIPVSSLGVKNVIKCFSKCLFDITGGRHQRNLREFSVAGFIFTSLRRAVAPIGVCLPNTDHATCDACRKWPHSCSGIDDERESLFSTQQQHLNKHTAEIQNQEGCQKGTWPIKAGHPLQQSRAAWQRQPCVNGDWLCQWAMAIFDPPQNKHPLTDHQKIWYR